MWECEFCGGLWPSAYCDECEDSNDLLGVVVTPCPLMLGGGKEEDCVHPSHDYSEGAHITSL